MNANWFSKKWVTITMHIVFWLLLFSLPALLRLQHHNNTAAEEVMGQRFFYQYLINCFSWIVLFYLNAYFFIPYLLKTKRPLKYVLLLLPVFVVLFVVHWLSFKIILPDIHYSIGGFIFFYFLPSLFVLSSSTAITMLRNKVESDKLAQQRENENLKTELVFLRSQISPHFMFNVLNNMVVLARKKSDQLEPSLFKLSSLLRYMLYETDEEKVLLEKEVEYLQSYIDLQMQRFGSKVTVNAHFDILDKAIVIEPMLLIPFVENAFKHGTSYKQGGVINIDLKAKNKLLQFTVSNYYNANCEQTKDKVSGIGLQNVKRRLNLLYKNNYSLLISDKNELFTITLTINLH